MVELTDYRPRPVYKTEDDKLVIRDMFKFYGSCGLPLEFILWSLESKGCVVDWLNFMTDALREGVSPKTLRSRILAAIGDVYGSEYRKSFEERLSRFLP